MLLTCPECERQVSDRAHACPGCGFPIAEHVSALALAEQRTSDRATRVTIGEVDCARCEARGFYTFAIETLDGTPEQAFEWCVVCEHVGRVTLCHSRRGFYAVAAAHLESFIEGRRDDGDEFVVFLGRDAPKDHRYPNPGKRVRGEAD